MRSLFVPLVLIALAVPAAAAEKEAPAKDAATGGAPGTNIDMPFLMAPMTGPDGKLSGYAYISTRLTATSDIIANQARDKIAFIQDAFVRDVNATEIATSGDPRTVNNSVLEARLLADARKVVGAGKIVSIAIVQVQIAPLHPGPVTAVAGQPTADSAPAAPVKPAATH
jgi:hypothetical protein